MFDLLVSPFFDSQGGQIKVRFGGTLRVRPTCQSGIFSKQREENQEGWDLLPLQSVAFPIGS